MRIQKMAELRFEAPLAVIDNEEWTEYQDAQNVNMDDADVQSVVSSSVVNTPVSNISSENFKEECASSLEDLVNSFDEKISNCFCNFEEQSEKIAPVQIRSHDDLVSNSQMWWTLTGNFGNFLPIDWSKTYARELYNKALHLKQVLRPEDENLDLPEDEELVQAFDMHSLIATSLHHCADSDCVESADEVIAQIENMMMDLPTDDDDDNGHVVDLPEDAHYSYVKDMLARLPSYSEVELAGKTCLELNGMVEMYESYGRQLNDILVKELAQRDEHAYNKELKNSFISLLLSIQRKRREANSGHKRRKSLFLPGLPSPADCGETANSFLTTVIPYHPSDGSPTSGRLQIFTEILEAIDCGSSTVPSLLTHYILNVLCPTH